MKKKLLKRLTTVVVAVAMVATMVMGFSVDVKAADSYNPGPYEKNLIDLVDDNSVYLICSDEGLLNKNLKDCFGMIYTKLGSPGDTLSGILDLCSSTGGISFSSDTDTWTISNNTDEFFIISAFVDSDNYISKVKFEYIIYEASQIFTFNNTNPKPTPAPSKADDKDEPKKEKAKEVDRDTFKSEAPYGTAGITNSNSKVGDLKVHKVNSITETNQKFLADAFAKQYGKKARILTTVSLHPRRELGVDNGKKESLIYSNLEKKPQTVYAVCYNQTDKAYYLTGTLDKNGVATFPGFILRDATNVTIFVLE